MLRIRSLSSVGADRTSTAHGRTKRHLIRETLARYHLGAQVEAPEETTRNSLTQFENRGAQPQNQRLSLTISKMIVLLDDPWSASAPGPLPNATMSSTVLAAAGA